MDNPLLEENQRLKKALEFYLQNPLNPSTPSQAEILNIEKTVKIENLPMSIGDSNKEKYVVLGEDTESEEELVIADLESF